MPRCPSIPPSFLLRLSHTAIPHRDYEAVFDGLARLQNHGQRHCQLPTKKDSHGQAQYISTPHSPCEVGLLATLRQSKPIKIQSLQPDFLLQNALLFCYKLHFCATQAQNLKLV